jgi:SAM-dependent methyltransferase
MKNVKNYRNNLYEGFHSNNRLQKKIISDNNFTYRELIKLLKPLLPKINNVLDIGSGVGTIDFYLGSKGKNVTGIEISQQAVNIAKLNAKIFNLEKKIEFINSTFPSRTITNKYDLVIFSEVIEHLENDKKALNDIWKVLKPGGFLIITTPSMNAPLYRLQLVHRFDKRVGHLRRYTIGNLSNIVIECGFNIILVGKHEGIIRNFLFTNKFAGKFIKFIKGVLSTFVSFVDSLTIPITGESNIHLVAQKVNYHSKN